MKIKLLLTIVIFLALLPSSTYSYSGKTYNESFFSIELPYSWNRADKSELNEFKKQIKKSGVDTIYNVFYDLPISVFNFIIPRKKSKNAYTAILIASKFTVPPQSIKLSTEQRYKNEIENTKEALKQHLIIKIYSIQIKEINGVTILEKNVETPTGRLISLTYYPSDHPKIGIGFDFTCKSKSYSKYQPIFNNIIKTLRISLQN